MSNRQLALSVTPRLAYDPKHYCIHAGVGELYAQCFQAFQSSKFFIAYIVGARRSGKSHLALRLAADAMERGLHVRLVDCAESEPDLAALCAERVGEKTILLIDSADMMLRELGPGKSGPLVALIEKYRVAGASVVMFAGTPISELPCDGHILSRLAAGATLTIDAPSDADMRELVHALARQRGISLTPRQENYLQKRLDRSVVAIEDYIDSLSHLSGVLGRAVPLPPVL